MPHGLNRRQFVDGSVFKVRARGEDELFSKVRRTLPDVSWFALDSRPPSADLRLPRE